MNKTLSNRFNFFEIAPKAFEAQQNFELSINLEGKYKELIKMRASVINNCAFCIQMHFNDAKNSGESNNRLYAIAAWQESPLFSNKERAILALTDEITNISKQGLSDSTYENCISILGVDRTAQCIAQIVSINTWNRIAISSKMHFTE